MSVPKVWSDPRYQEAVRMFDLAGISGDWGIPSDPHAKENLRHACGILAAGQERAQQILENAVKQYLGAKYQQAMLRTLERIAAAAAKVAMRDG